MVINKLKKSFFIFHVALITGAAAFQSASNYAIFFNKKSEALSRSSEIIKNDFLDTYLQFSGLETGYGFFGYNVRSSGILHFKIDTTEMVPFFNSYESSIRFGSLVSFITDPYLKDTTNNQAKSHWNNELMMRNMALKILNIKQFQYSNNIKLIYRILEFPTLVEYRVNKGSFSEAEIFQINYKKENNVN